jgi:hypothetical protein
LDWVWVFEEEDQEKDEEKKEEECRSLFAYHSGVDLLGVERKEEL